MMFNYEVSIDDRHNVKLSASTPYKIAKLLWSQTLASDVSMDKVDYKIIENEVLAVGLPENLVLWTYDCEYDCEEFTIDTTIIDTEEKLMAFVDFIKSVFKYVHKNNRLEVLRIDNTSNCILM